MILALISQKGGVGKSTLARLVAVELTRAGWSVKIADLDPAQGTSAKWKARRDELSIDPEIPVEKYRDAERAIRTAADWDLMILDGPAHASRSGLTMAKAADLVILPTGRSLDDLDPQISLAYDLETAGINPDKVWLAFCRAQGSTADDTQARNFVRRARVKVLDGALRELPSIRQGHNMGLAASETKHKTVDAEAKRLASEISQILTKG